MKILIVEDEVLIREGMSDYLMECDYEVFEAGDGQEALDLFHREAPDLVLLDIQLPILNGLEVLKTIKILIHAGESQVGDLIELP